MFATFFDIVAAMRSNRPLLYKGSRAWVIGIAQEDGSGRSWNVTILKEGNGKNTTVYWHETRHAIDFNLSY
jgi:hypothetical protein